MDWQPQTYSNGNATGRAFIDVDEDVSRLRIFKEADGKLWCMFYPNKKNKELFYQPGIGNALGRNKEYPTPEQWAVYENLLKAK